MGVEARFQAMPENCELFIAARQDREIAQMMQFFEMYAPHENPGHMKINPKRLEFHTKARKVLVETPGLLDRYFYAGGRTFDAIVYLLSPVRRAITAERDTSLIHIAVRGFEALHPLAQASQGGPINFVPAWLVPFIVESLEFVTWDVLREHYDPQWMHEAGVYKMHPFDQDGTFETIWYEFEGMRNVYRVATDHNEAVITVIA